MQGNTANFYESEKRAKQQSFKTMARQAKRRMKTGFWETCKEDMNERLYRAKELGLNESKAGRYFKEKVEERLMGAEKDYEKTGFTSNVIFPTCALTDSKGRIAVYYGAADTNMAIAFTTVDKLLEFAKKYNA